MARPARGKSTTSNDGTRVVASKNPSGAGSEYFEPATNNSDGSQTPGRWPATWLDQNGKIRRVSAPTRLEAEDRRDARVAAVGKRLRPASRFGPESTVNDLLEFSVV